MDNSEIIFYLNQEVLSLNKSIKQLEQKKTAVLEMLEERVKQEKQEAENKMKENEINQKQKYLSQIYGKNKDNKVIQTNNIKRDQQQNNSIFEASQNPYQNVFGRITDIDYDKRSQNKMQIEYDPMGVSNASNNNSFSRQNQKQTRSQNGMASEFDERMEKMEQDDIDYKEALQKYFDIPQPVMKNLSQIDELTEEKLNQTGQYFGLKTGKANQKSLKQGLKDINWFLTRNKLPQGYLQNYKSGIEQEISIPQESLVTVFDYKH
ncbi:hypothetical protein PPERSA_01817 [Pseudocohnilembus persalinus]|uniref:Uncharacterized protein n=1 Tax=Pseudocohnilembus persalinus TaxID=266149 RepID=A0A0V0QKS4_PSEPJ|nr:hypothetical protein PPERSA_01817 [Pseudocohnilembus persalinus]|eukprot:KRX02700.1 hypothetical protein PPERSA_01817 [Pseudocohnilembus persalinus]